MSGGKSEAGRRVEGGMAIANARFALVGEAGTGDDLYRENLAGTVSPVNWNVNAKYYPFHGGSLGL